MARSETKTNTAADVTPRRWPMLLVVTISVMGEPVRVQVSIGAGFVLPWWRGRQLNDRFTFWVDLPTIACRLRRETAGRVEFPMERPSQRAAPLRPVHLDGRETSCACQHRTSVAPRLRHRLFLLEEPASLAAHDEHLFLCPLIPDVTCCPRSVSLRGRHRESEARNGSPAVSRTAQYRRSRFWIPA